ncbi:hypothetical protein BGZ95_010582, partial [Linnemannia exigua]
FLTPAELWKLSMASREMHRQVNGFMSRIQRFKYGAVQILHQENAGMMYSSASAGGGGSPVQSILARIKGTSNPRSRQSYWEAQGELLVTIIVEGTAYEPKPGSRQAKEANTKFFLETGANPAALTQAQLDHANNADTIVTITPMDTTTTTTTSSSMAAQEMQLQQQQQQQQETSSSPAPISSSPSSSTLVSSYASASTSQLSLVSSNKRTATDDTIQLLGPLPMDRFQAMVDLLFDPNMVYLNHRRAIINCARYVSASIADYFKEALSTKDPLDPAFHATFLRQYTVRTGPYLAVFLYDVDDEDEFNNGSSAQPRTSQGPGSTLIAPPCRLQKYFQVMLWHRCLSDLISLYNRIQRLHVDVTPSSSSSFSSKKSKEWTSPEPLEPLTQPNRAVCCQDQPSIPSSSSAASHSASSPAMAESYPFCCNAHSLVFTTHYPASVPIPFPIRQKLRRMAQKLQTKNLWAAVLQGHSTNVVQWEESPTGRHVQYTGSTEKLRFCNGVARPVSPAILVAAASGMSASSSSSLKQRREMDDDELVQRRYRIEERIRQDTLLKQELLSLCLMACGLFMIDGRSPHVPPTLMSLLRHYGPWDKGVWREGEWRRSAIELTSGTGLEERGATRAYRKKKSMSPSMSSTFSISSLARGATSAAVAAVDGIQAETTAKNNNKDERGPWQNLCIAAIQFLAHENLTWGGATGNEELSRLRVTINSTQWIYHE